MKRKNIYVKLFFTGMLAATISSCKKSFLDTKIDTSQTAQTLNSNYNSLYGFGNAPYTYLRNEFAIIDNNLFAPVSDEAKQTAASSNVMLFNNGSWNASNNPDNNYANYYSGIRAANYFLENSGNYKWFLAMNRDTISASGKLSYHNDVLNIAWYRGEAHILRAWYYFELAKRYGGVPLVTKTLSITDNTNIAKASYDDIINFITSEVDNFKDSLQVNWKTSSFSNNDGRLSKGAALALKARALLFAASPLHNSANDVTRWQSAATALHDLVAFGQAAGQYALDGDYRKYFLLNNTLTSAETIWAIRYPANSVLETQNYPITTQGGASGITPSQNLVDDYEYTSAPDPLNPYANRDPRLSFSIVTNNSTWNGRIINEASGGTDDMSITNTSRTGYYLKKFVNDSFNLTQGQTAVHNFPIFRYGEVLLEYAEAMNEAYGPDNANGYALSARMALNMVRSRAGVQMPLIIAAGQASFRTAIKHERRIELAFEDYRYWDLLRWKDAVTVLNQPIRGVAVGKDASGKFTYNTNVVVENRVFDVVKMYYYPFPQSEVSKSKGILIQNQGW
ncbi:Starch-binding associating with outer membrane [Mucilaginibacter sp. OK268]|uniref:RagB/SusD family nutrient uptake outer membrane protein n=1 Tax=Mucilaginibacter sp. OK268 TaxID=1881048 RepID=UPI00087E82CB|nr:RagB/SusD family nutrient uptake outer membrane protein [Mucilaginibacter sp. OK268]SDP86186.1 Starch-binding associating with outer membrane [Mucilaginibacter sp. OK268]